MSGKPTKASSGDITFFLDAAGGPVRIVADASSGLTATSVVVGATYDVTGVAGQRASRKGALDGYRVWPRDARDLVKRAGPSASPTPSPSSGGGGPGPTASPAAGVITIAEAVRRGSGAVVVEGLVTAPSDLLDATGRRIVVEDRTAGLEILLPADAAVPPVGARIRAAGQIGRAYDAPRLRADALNVLAVGGRPLPLTITSPPTAAHEWRLVVVSGVVADVHKLGDRWRAELSVGRDTVVVNGLAGAGIAASSVVEGRRATVVGIVRRPYPGASDRRWSVVPRGPADVDLGGTAASGGSGTAGGSGGSSGSGSATGGTGVGAAVDGPTVPDVDLVTLADHVGQTVRVGGLVAELAPDGFRLDDGTAIGRVVLTGEAADYLPLIDPGDALNATGRVEVDGEEPRVVVTDAAGLVRVGDLTRGERTRSGWRQPRPRRRRTTARPPRAASPAASSDPSGRGPPGSPGSSRSAASRSLVTVLRRRRARRLLAVRVGARLAGIAGPSVAAPPG